MGISVGSWGQGEDSRSSWPGTVYRTAGERYGDLGILRLEVLDNNKNIQKCQKQNKPTTSPHHLSTLLSQQQLPSYIQNLTYNLAPFVFPIISFTFFSPLSFLRSSLSISLKNASSSLLNPSSPNNSTLSLDRKISQHNPKHSPLSQVLTYTSPAS